MRIWFILLLSITLLWSNSEKELFKQGQQKFAQKKYIDAISYFEQVIQQDNSNFEAHYRLFECYQSLQKYETALKFLQKSADIRPSYSLYFELGNLAEKYKEDGIAEDAYRKALKLEDHIEVYRRLSIVLEAQNKNQEAWDIRVYGVEQELPETRGLTFKNKTIAGVKTRPELEDFLVEELEKEITPEKAKEMAATLFAFGMTDEMIDIKTLYINLLTEQIGGFYNPETKKLYLISEESSFSFWENLFPLTRNDAEDRMVLAHEMTHALQDQYYDLLPLQKKFQQDDDMSQALTSLIEGDATLAMLDYNNAPMKALKSQEAAYRSMFSMMSFLGSFLGGQELAKAPLIMREGLMFPYIEGFFFCLALRGNNEQELWKNINDAYSNPPKSTEQILHPEKYLQQDVPLDFEYTEEQILPLNNSLISSNVMGEFGCQMFFKEHGISDYEKIAAGWGGDRYFIFENESSEITFCWLNVWDTIKDANEFSSACKNLPGMQVQQKNKYVLVTNCKDYSQEQINNIFTTIKTAAK